MDIQKISDLVELLSRSTLTDLTLREGDTSLSLSKGGKAAAADAGAVATAPMVVTASPVPVAAALSSTAAAPAAPAPAATAPSPDTFVLTSPLVGTFYRASAPDAAPFVNIGDVIEAGQIVGVIEAMKMLNEIEAERAGEVVEVHVENGTFVEYGQALVTLRVSQ